MKPYTLSVKLILAFCLCVLRVHSIQAMELLGTVTKSEESITLRLTWQDPNLSCEHSVYRRQALLRFNREIQLKNQLELWKAGQPWIVDLVLGYDTLMIKLKDKAKFVLEPIENGALLTVQAKKKIGRPTKRSNKRLKLLKVRLLLEQRQTSEALEILEALHKEEPEDVSVLVSLADLTFQAGEREKAIKLILEAESLDPENLEIARLKKQFLLPTRPFVRLESSRKGVNASLSENFYRIHVKTRPLDGLMMGVKYVTRDIVRDTTGILSAAENGISMVELYYQMDNDDTVFPSLSLFFNEQVFIGLSRDFTFNGTNQSLIFGFDINRPLWDFSTSQVEDGRRNRLRFTYNRWMSFPLRFTLDAALNHYMLNTTSTDPVTTVFQGNIAYETPKNSVLRSWMGESGYQSFGYDIDLEAPVLNVENASTLWRTYSRLTHGPRFYLGKRRENWSFLGYLGYSFRIFGSEGGFFGARATYGENTEKSFYAAYDRYVDESANQVSLFVLGFNWIF